MTINNGVLSLLLLAACVSCQGVNPYRDLRQVSRDGGGYYLDARAAWATFHATPGLDSEASRLRVTEIVTQLDRALVNDPSSPLFLQQRGDMRFQLEDFDGAADDYRSAVAVCEDWVPGHLGLARVALVSRNAKLALGHVANAVLGIESLEAAGQRGLPNPLKLIGLWIEFPEYRDPLDPSVSRGQGHRLLMHWLFEHLEWRVDNDALARGLKRSPGNEIGVLSALRARAAFAKLTAKRPDARDDPEGYLRQLEGEVLAHDRDYFDARFQQAYVFYLLGRLGDAEAVLDPLWRSSNPMISSHAGVAALATQVYSEHYVDAAKAVRDRKAVPFFRWLEARHGGYRDGVYKMAQDFVLACNDADRIRLRRVQAAVGKLATGDERERALGRRLAGAVRAELEEEAQ